MNPFMIPWLQLAVLLPLVGAVPVLMSRSSQVASRWTLAFSGLAFVCAFMAWLGFYTGHPDASLWGILSVDELSAPLVPAVALLHFFTALMTARIRERQFSFVGLLVGESIKLATFGCTGPTLIIALLALGVVPMFVELKMRGKSTRVFSIHMLVFITLLVIGYLTNEVGNRSLASAMLLIAILVRCGAVPLHTWVVDLFENASFGTALMMITPLTGVYAAVRLVLPNAEDWVLQSIGILSLITAVYTAGLAVVQEDTRRFFAYLFLSHASLVLVGLELHTHLSLTGALCLWFSVMLSLGGFGLALRALEARFGRLSLTRYHGLYDQSPGLALAFMLMGLAAVGFPGTLGFISAELLIDGAIEENLLLGLVITLTTALNGIAIVRAYFLLFTGTTHQSTIPLGITTRERIAMISLIAIVLGGGLMPQPGVVTRHHAADEVLALRLIVKE